MRKQILFVGHDANRAGAQIFLLQVIRSLSERYTCSLLLLAPGDLISAYEEVCTVYHGYSLPKRWWQKTNPLAQDSLKGKEFDLIYLNTIAVAAAFPWLKQHVKGKYISHLHELAYSQSLYSIPADREFLFTKADGFVGCSEAVSSYIRPQIPDSTPVFTVHSFIENDAVLARIKQAGEKVSRASLGISETAFLVGGCGHAEWRKGIDWFLSTAAELGIEANLIHFLWIGLPEVGILAEQVHYDVARLGLTDRITFLPVTPLAVEWLAQLDLFLLPSREDPFPLVMLEAALAGVPVLGFDQSGGCAEFVRGGTGWVVPYGNCRAMAQQIHAIQGDPIARQQAGERAQQAVQQTYQFDRSMAQLEKILTYLMNL